MARVGRAALVCGVWLYLATPLPSAVAARSRTEPAALAAVKLARIIRRDARLQIRRFRHAVTVTRRCCGVRVLRVHYSARPAGSRNDAYVLSVETRSGVLKSVALSEHSSEKKLEPGGRVSEITLDSSFTITHVRAGGHGTWFVSAESAEVGTTTGGTGPQSGTGFSSACGQPGRMSLVLYRHALTSLGRARHHDPAAFAGLAVSACR